MNLIQYASKKERVHVEQIIREQPVLKGADNVTNQNNLRTQEPRSDDGCLCTCRSF